ncbi:MAG: excisionase family DNA-binding protein [Thiohalomonadales bacterium]
MTKPTPTLSRTQAAQYLGCSVSYLEKKAMNEPGLIPFIKVGKSSRYRQADLDRHIQMKTQAK